MTNPFALPDRLYNVLKQVALILLPALSTLYFMLSNIWNLPHVTAVIGTIAAIDTFLGAILGVSTTAYNNSDSKYDGSMHVTINPETETTTYMLELSSDPVSLANKKSISFKVEPSS